MITTTLRDLRRFGACKYGYRRLTRYLGGARAYGDTTPISILDILAANGTADTCWVLSRLGRYDIVIPTLATVAERALLVYEAERPTDKRPRLCVEGVKAFLRGEIPADDLAMPAANAFDAAECILDLAFDLAYAANACGHAASAAFCTAYPAEQPTVALHATAAVSYAVAAAPDPITESVWQHRHMMTILREQDNP